MIARRSRALARLAALAAVAAVCVGASVRADSSWVTEDDLIDAILERGNFTQQELDELDLNRDGSRDIADLICFRGRCHQQANFAEASSQFEEDAGAIAIRVVFDQPVTGELVYSLGGTANFFDIINTSDYRVQLDGVTETNIVLTIKNDDTFGEEAEWIFVDLEEGTGYSLGSRIRHRVQILENDTRWVGTLESGGGALGFFMDVTHSTEGYSAVLVGENAGLLPDGDFPALSFDLVPDVSFSAEVRDIEMPTAATNLQLAITRKLEFNPDGVESTPPALRTFAVDLLSGVYRESRTSDEQPHINHEIVGRFQLKRSLPRSSSFDAELEQ